MSKCNKCFHSCHCAEDKNLHTDIYGVCTCEHCTCKKTIGELAKANPNKTYRELDSMRDEDLSYENNGGLVIDDTNECEGCQ